MTFGQEEAIYDFLDNMADPFDLEMIMSYIRLVDSTRISHLADEVKNFINDHKLAFNMRTRQWISRRGYFETMPFVISPTKLELLNGILIPGHRCVPFANPNMLPHEYIFHWKGSVIPYTTTEGDPEEFYPYYNILGEEYAPQYVARDNPENEEVFYGDPYEDPAEVSISTLDMRNIYRETSFIPGDRFVARTMDWSRGIFSLERIGVNDWDSADLYSWFETAEAGFEDSFYNLGPGSSTDEQISYAYWYGGKRMRQIPAYSLEEFLYEKTELIETASYGIETRFWYAGREIPDLKGLDGLQFRNGKTQIEKFMSEKMAPVSEFVIRSYIQDYLYRGEKDTKALIQRIVPPPVQINERDQKILEEYIYAELGELEESYSPFTDKFTGPIRQRVAELHTAIIELTVRLDKENMEPSWLPKHTYIILSQIQSHAAGVMEDLETDEDFLHDELEAMDNSVDSMIETYEDLKNSIEEAMENFRRNRFSLVRKSNMENGEWLIQLGIGGTDVWRRIIIPEDTLLEEFHGIIQNVFGWKNSHIYQFSSDRVLDNHITIGELGNKGMIELLYEYGAKWTVKIMLLSKNAETEGKPVRCVAGAGAAPPETIGGPLRFRRIISALSGVNDTERRGADLELGYGFKPDAFDIESCNRNLNSGLTLKAVNHIEGNKND